MRRYRSAAMILLLAACAPARAEGPATPSTPAPAQIAPTAPPPPPNPALAITIKQFGIAAPTSVTDAPAIQAPLAELAREKCDQKAIFALGQALDKVGYRRDTATAHVKFSAACGGHAPSLFAAANNLLGLSDGKAALDAANELVALQPYNAEVYELRAKAHDRVSAFPAAVDDYTKAIELAGNRFRPGNITHLLLARDLAKTGRFCDAAATVQNWVWIMPEQNDTATTQAMITDYASKGQCDAAAPAIEEVFAIARPGAVIRMPLVINGVRGTFILDTGASSIAMRKSFADKAKVTYEGTGPLQINTANGVGEGRRARAATAQLRSLKAENITVIVQPDAKGNYGTGVDGLLGMSFLSRFKVTIDQTTVRVTPRTKK